MAWPKGRPRRAVEGAAAETAVVEADEPQQNQADPVPEGFEPFLAWAEQHKIADGVVVVELTHPAAPDRHWDGRFSGFRVSAGPASVLWSNGQRFPEQ